jgi:uncharacterized protein YhfF
MWPRVGALRALELGTPGEMRTWLNGLVLDGSKRATAGLYQADYLDEGEELEVPGERLALVDSDGGFVAEVEVTAASLVPLSAVTWEFAEAEGEGFRSVDHWREVHTRFWAAAGNEVTDESIVTCVSFRLVR